MTVDDQRSDLYQDQADRLLARGGRILGLSAVAKARGQRPGQGSWFVLSPPIVAAAEEILGVLEQPMEEDLLEAVVQAAMDHPPATKAPTWCAPIWQSPDILERLGRALEGKVPAEIFGRGNPTPNYRTRGLAGVAVALSRSMDGLRALAMKLGDAEAAPLLRMGHLAQVVVTAGEPSRMRKLLRRLLAASEEASDG